MVRLSHIQALMDGKPIPKDVPSPVKATQAEVSQSKQANGENSKRKRGRPKASERDAIIVQTAKEQELASSPAELAKLLNGDSSFVERFGELNREKVRNALRRKMKRGQK